MAGSELHEFLRPRLQGVMAEAEAKGFDHELVVAVMIDVVTGSAVNDAPLPDEPPVPPGPWPHPRNDDDITEELPEVSGHLPNLVGNMHGRGGI